MKKYLIPSLLISTLLLVAFYFLNSSLFNGYLHPKFGLLVIIFFLQSIPVAWLMEAGQKDATQFPIYVIGAVGFRMITSLMILTIFYVLKTPEITDLMVQFSILYLVYLVFELIVVLANLRRN
ncbi:MAG: hypothetical protein ACFHWX_21320 [Bacteroidota bacterium]